MNHTIQRRRRALTAEVASRTSPWEHLPPGEEVVDQARALDESFKGFARHLLGEDDPASALPLRQLRVCAALYVAPQSMSALGRELGFSLSAMTQIADRLERAGLVTRWFDAPDRRVRRLRLTPRARRMLRLREEARIRRVAAVLATMTDEARESTLSAFKALRQAAQAVALSEQQAACDSPKF